MTPDTTAVELLHKFGKPERIITFICPHEGLVIALYRSNHGLDLFDMVSAFTVAGKWHASMDLHNAEAPEVYGKLADRIN